MASKVRLDTKVLDHLIQNTPDRIDQFLRVVATEITNDIKLSFTASPSSPGEPPGVDTGALRASMRWEQVKRLQYLVMDGVEYGVFLEYGTPKMEARPFVAPVFDAWHKKILQESKAFGLVVA